MTQSPKQANEFANLPILTEVLDADADHFDRLKTEIPTLTEIIAEGVPALIMQTAAPAPLSDVECQRLAAQIAPQMETLLRDKLAPRFEALWQEAWREAQAGLPGLIRTRLAAATQSDSENSTSAYLQGVGRGCTKDRQSTDETTSHPTKQPKDGCQEVGYTQQAACGIDTTADEPATTTHSADS